MTHHRLPLSPFLGLMLYLLAACGSDAENNSSPARVSTQAAAVQCPVKPAEQVQHFWGALHEHTAYSDGTLLTKPADVFKRVQSKGLDFAFSTDHSDNMALPVPLPEPEGCLSNPLSCVLSDPSNPLSNLNKWDATLKQAQAASSNTFTAMRGFEWTSDRFGHANVLFSSHHINPKLGPGYLLTMAGFWAWFSAPARFGGGDDGLMVFNHPGREDAIHNALVQLGQGIGGATRMLGALQQVQVVQQLGQGDPAYAFNDFELVPQAAARVVGLEVFGKSDEYDTEGKGQSWLGYALDKGWLVAPTGSEDHHGTEWGESNLPKTVLLATSNSPTELRKAMQARRMYAVAQNFNNLKLDWSATDGAMVYLMGSQVVTSSKNLVLNMSVSTRPGQAPPLGNDQLELHLLSSQGNNAERYTPLRVVPGASAQFELPTRAQRDWAFVRVVKRDTQKVIAVSAPIWFEQGQQTQQPCGI